MSSASSNEYKNRDTNLSIGFEKFEEDFQANPNTMFIASNEPENNIGTTRILKYPVNGNGAVTAIICRRYRLLDIQLQGDDLVCWIETRDSCPETTTRLLSIGTGWEMPSEFMSGSFYIKTVQDAYGYVWHFYEVDRDEG